MEHKRSDSGKKNSGTKKEASSPQIPGYWEAPPVAPIHSIRSMMSSLEKEFELLNATNDKKNEQLKQSINTVIEASPKKPTSISASSPIVASTPIQQFSYKPVVNKGYSNNYNSNIRRTVSHIPPKIVNPVQKTLSLTKQSSFTFDRYKRYKSMVLQAYQNRKIFTIHCYLPIVRQALLNRGWLEKLPLKSYPGLQRLSQHTLMQNARNGNDYETMILSKMLESYPSYFIWQPKNYYDFNNYALPYRNRIKLTGDLDFTTKEGLLSTIYRAYASPNINTASIIAPRTYRLAYSTEISNFERDFKLSSCFNLILFVSEQSNPSNIFDPSGQVPISWLKFAFDRVEKEISIKKGMNSSISDFKMVNDLAWQNFLVNCDKIVRFKGKFLGDSSENTTNWERAKSLTAEAKQLWPNIKMDGYLNIWILKPSFRCRGDGILLMTDLSKILSYARKYFKLRYVAQKYMERPLQIYKTKFDIRQYVLVTISENITIYVYKDIYVKFSSQEFNLSSLHESVHITNFAIQSKYKNGKRSELLPVHNMWSLNDLKNYFKTIKKDNIWENFIFPRIKDTIVAIMLASLDSASLVTNAFELYGVDLMLTEDFEPVIIEINATPDLSHSTPVTARICTAAQEDLIKVVVDLPKNYRTDIGNFEACCRVPWSKGARIAFPAVNFIKGSMKTVPDFIKPDTVKKWSRGSRSSNAIRRLAGEDSARKRGIFTVPCTSVVKSPPKNISGANSADTLIQQFIDVVKGIHCLNPNVSKKEIITNHVLGIIEGLQKKRSKTDVKGNGKNKNQQLMDDKLVANFIEVVYSKIWK